MENTKQFMTDFLQQTGATAETVAKFNELYDQDIQEAMQREAQGSLYQSREAVAQGTQHIQAMAAKHNIRNRR